MIIMINTSTPVCELYFVDGDWEYEQRWDSGRGLAKGLLSFIYDQLKQNNRDWNDISGVVVFKGPGSFTGLRIGITVMNTIANAQSVPIVGTTGDNWRADGLEKILGGKDEKMVLPEYGRQANITVSTK